MQTRAWKDCYRLEKILGEGLEKLNQFCLSKGRYGGDGSQCAQGKNVEVLTNLLSSTKRKL